MSLKYAKQTHSDDDDETLTIVRIIDTQAHVWRAECVNESPLLMANS